jgi:tRNA dimethylallyltransferase
MSLQRPAVSGQPHADLAIAVVGPTGSGKSDLGLALAEAFSGEIVNCDSIQVYRGLEIGAAKLPVPARRGIPHHLLDVIDLDEELTAGAYARLARKILVEIRDRGRLPIVVGGTGFYLRALFDGLSPAPGRDEHLRSRLREVAARRPGTLHRYLNALDPEAARRIHPNDHQKLIRAIEMMALARQPASATQSLPRAPMEGFTVLKLGLAPERQKLYEKLDQRSAQMFEHGLLAETERLLKRGISSHTKPLQSLGYKQAVEVLMGRINREDAIRECQTRTRQYAKRQLTWFRHEPDVRWLNGFGDEEWIQREATGISAKFLS